MYPIITLNLFSVFIISIMSVKVFVNISISAKGAEFGQYTVPMIVLFACWWSTSTKNETCGINTLRPSRILYLIESLMNIATPHWLLFSLQRYKISWKPVSLSLSSLLHWNASLIPIKSKVTSSFRNSQIQFFYFLSNPICYICLDNLDGSKKLMHFLYLIWRKSFSFKVVAV